MKTPHHRISEMLAIRKAVWPVMKLQVEQTAAALYPNIPAENRRDGHP